MFYVLNYTWLQKVEYLLNRNFVRIHAHRHIFGKHAPGATFHYEFCCSVPQNAQTLHALESSIFIRILCSLLRFSDLYLVETIRSPKLGSLLLIYELNFEGPCCTGFN